MRWPQSARTRTHLEATGGLLSRRREQILIGFRRAVERALAARVLARAELTTLEDELASGRTSMHDAIRRALALG